MGKTIAGLTPDNPPRLLFAGEDFVGRGMNRDPYKREIWVCGYSFRSTKYKGERLNLPFTKTIGTRQTPVHLSCGLLGYPAHEE